MVFGALIIGIIIGLIYGFGRSLELKLRVRLLKKDLEDLKNHNTKSLEKEFRFYFSCSS